MNQTDLKSTDNNCKKCNEPVHGNFCPNCGYPATLKKINGRYILHEIGDVLFVNSGLFYTIKNMMIKPGKTVQHFITEDRSRYIRPITFLVITSLIYAIVNYFFQIETEDFYIHPFLNVGIEGLPTAAVMVKWLAENFVYSNILTGLFMAFGIKIFFRKVGYNIFEIFTLLCFVTGILTLFFSVCTILQSVTHQKIIQNTTFVAMIYISWAIGQFFDRKRILSYLKAFMSFLLGVLTLIILIVLIGILIDMIIKY
jgi:hypothetical protein